MDYRNKNIIGAIEERLRSENSSKIFEAIGSEIIIQINSDGDSINHIGRDLWHVYKQNPDVADSVLMALCGWSMKSILTFVGLIDDDEGLICR